MSFLIVMVLVLVVMYVLMIRPRQRAQREQQSKVDQLSVGDDVLTTGGIYGTITQVEGDDLVVELAKGLEVHMTRRGVAAVLPPESGEEVEVATEDGEKQEISVPEADDAEEIRRRVMKEG